MRYTDEFRNASRVKKLTQELSNITTKPWVIMEICGGQTHSFMHFGIDQLLPPNIEMVHGPGCPVCVTPLEMIDKALALASDPGFILTSYGDMLRVPGSKEDLFSIRAKGGAVKFVYSPLDAVKIAQENPDQQVVFFAIGFETTAPANAMSVILAKKLGLTNFSLLVSQVRVPPAMEAILSSPQNRVQGFLAAGHVSAVMGYWEYPPIADKYHVPMAITGFEPVDLLTGLIDCITMLEKNENKVMNSYSRAVTEKGNIAAQETINKVFVPADRAWRGIGIIPLSGLSLNDEYAIFDAEKRYDLGYIQAKESEICIAGQILQGNKKPHQCPAFGTLCTPENPVGAPMVSNEGACSAYYRYGKKTVS